jgi:hypothetical protein
MKEQLSGESALNELLGFAALILFKPNYSSILPQNFMGKHNPEA